MSRVDAAPGAAVPVSNARAEASRRNGARSRGPRTPEGKARAAQNSLKHGMRAQKYLVLPEEDAKEFAGLEAAVTLELAPVGALQTVLARRVAVAAWRLARADRLETELFEENRAPHGGSGLALIRDGNGTRSFETLLRYRGAAMAEFWRALKTLKALQAEQALATDAVPEAHLTARLAEPATRPPLAARPQPDEPERSAQRRLAYAVAGPGGPGSGRHESPATWRPNEPEPMPAEPAERLRGGRPPGCTNEPGLAGSGDQARAAAPGAQPPTRGAIMPPGSAEIPLRPLSWRGRRRRSSGGRTG
jgi:hypothetical protein